jgi:copper chaperone CopZ
MDPNLYVHMLNGRLRVKVPEVKGSRHEAKKLEAAMIATGGIAHAKANPTTGNVLILFDPAKLTHAQILDLIRKVGYLKIPPSQPDMGDRSADKIASLLLTEVVKVAAQVTLERLIFSLI